MLLELFPFRYRDPLTGKWTHARYVAKLHVIAERYEHWQITGPPEIRSGGSGSFNPFRRSAMYAAHLPMNETPAVKQSSVEDELERFVVLLFLRRYVTYCARRQRFAAMNGAAKLFAEMRAQSGRLPRSRNAAA